MIKCIAWRTDGTATSIKVPDRKNVESFLHGIKVQLMIPGKSLTRENFHTELYEKVTTMRGRILYPFNARRIKSKLKEKVRRKKFRKGRMVTVAEAA